MGLTESIADALIRRLAKSPEDEARIRRELQVKEASEAALAPHGLADWQLDNLRMEALRMPYRLSAGEFIAAVLPAIRHINSMPEDMMDDRVAMLLFAFAGDDWRASSLAVDCLLGLCDARSVRDFVHGVCGAYATIKRSEREQQPRLNAHWNRNCPACCRLQPMEFDAADLLAQFAAGRYELAHEVCDDHGDLVCLCSGPFFQPGRLESA